MAVDPAIAVELEGLSYQREMNEAMVRCDSEIQRFYSGLTVFLTGGSGFIGKQLIEKLFRSCEIHKVIVLIRKKKGKSTQERLQEMLKDPVFEMVREKKPNFEERLVAIEGDVAEIGLGIGEEDWNTIIEEVNMIFHVAATIRFDEAIHVATITNIRGTREALTLGKACKKLKSFVHISTAYTHTTSGRVGGDVMEQFYACPVAPNVMIDMAEKMDRGRLDNLTASLIKGWPNTYTFTKAIAEELVRTECGDLQVSIVRPSIVLGAYVEPSPGWLDASCVYGPSGIVLGVGLGVTRVIYVNNKSKLSFVPVDFVNNATIAAGWDTAVRPTKEIRIFNISTTNCGVTFRHISEPMREKCRAIQTDKAIWYCYLFETGNSVVHWFASWLLHYIPAYVVDAAIKVFGIKTPKELKSFVYVYTKYDKLTKIFEFFLTNEWNFDETNLVSLWDRMSGTDRKIYNFEMSSIDFDWYTVIWCLGVRKYIIKDGLKNTNKAIAKQKWFKIANYMVFFVYLFIVFIFIRLFFMLF